MGRVGCAYCSGRGGPRGEGVTARDEGLANAPRRPSCTPVALASRVGRCERPARPPRRSARPRRPRRNRPSGAALAPNESAHRDRPGLCHVDCPFPHRHVARAALRAHTLARVVFDRVVRLHASPSRRVLPRLLDRPRSSAPLARPEARVGTPPPLIARFIQRTSTWRRTAANRWSASRSPRTGALRNPGHLAPPPATPVTAAPPPAPPPAGRTRPARTA